MTGLNLNDPNIINTDSLLIVTLKWEIAAARKRIIILNLIGIPNPLDSIGEESDLTLDKIGMMKVSILIIQGIQV